jgi:hypothetical protein
MSSNPINPDVSVSIKKKRSKPKPKYEKIVPVEPDVAIKNESPIVAINDSVSPTLVDNNVITIQIIEDEPKPADEECISKKRGRKPKGGKLISKKSEKYDKTDAVVNVILHLKCSQKELTEYNSKLNKLMTNEMEYNPEIPPEIQTYNSEKCGIYQNVFTTYEPGISNTYTSSGSDLAYADASHKPVTPKNSMYCDVCNSTIEPSESEPDSDINIKDVNHKLKQLKINLYKNTINDNKSACFWCTYEYDTPICYIPKYETDQMLFGYGSFCRPECAVAYLMKENIDDSVKFERYQLLNHIYSQVYNYKKNIKPAPNPYYLLDKFYGNLSIQEYRRLLKTEHLLTTVEKPMTRILPELFEDNDNFILGIYGGSASSTTNANSMYKVKRQSEKTQGPSKSKIMREKFGI